eukprot:973993-Prymnesium_polylepis.1
MCIAPHAVSRSCGQRRRVWAGSTCMRGRSVAVLLERAMRCASPCASRPRRKSGRGRGPGPA